MEPDRRVVADPARDRVARKGVSRVRIAIAVAIVAVGISLSGLGYATAGASRAAHSATKAADRAERATDNLQAELDRRTASRDAQSLRDRAVTRQAVCAVLPNLPDPDGAVQILAKNLQCPLPESPAS